MAKILKFPTRQELEEKESIKILDNYSDNCIDGAHFLLEVLEEFINTGQVHPDFIDMNFRDETVQESRDMFVVVNMINAMFQRYYGMPHRLHREMDRSYIAVKKLIELNEKAQEELDDLDIIFTPEEPDDTD